MAEKVDPEVSKLEVGALNEYFAGEAKNIELTKNNYLPPNWQDLDLNDPRITAAPFELQPFTTEEGMKARGILDDKGEATQLGKDYLLLEERGLFKDGELTEKGKAFTSENEIYDTVNFVDKNMDASQLAEKARLHSIREEAGLTKESMVSEDGMLADFWNGIKGLATGADTILRGTVPNARDLAKNRIPKDASLLEAVSDIMASGKSKEEVTTARAEAASKFVGGGATSIVKGAEPLQNLGANVGEALGLYSPEEAKAGKEQASYKTEMFKRTYAGIDAAEFASQVGLAEEVGNAVFETKKQYDAQYGEKGTEEFQKALNNYGSVGTVAGDPIGLAIGGGVGTAIGLVKYANAARNATKIAQGMAAVNRGQLLVKEQAKLSSVASGLQKESAIIQGQLDDALKIGATEKATELTNRLDGVTASTRELGSRLTTINEGIANASTFANKVEIGLDSARTVQDVIRGAGAATIGKTASVLDSVGNKAAGLNGFIKSAEKAIGIGRIPWIIRAAAAVPYSSIMVPYLGTRIGIAVAPKVFKGIAKFATVMSEEMVERTSSTPFFRRVAANERVGGLGGALATLGDYSSPLARGVARAAVGTAIAAPATLAYNAINNKGVDEETLLLAGRDALVFGGLGRLVGGRKDFSQTKIDEMVNYRSKLTPENLTIYDGIKDRGMRTFVSSLDAAYPGFFEWEFKNSGNNLFDPAARKAVVNLNDRAGFLKAVAAHEVGHMIQFRHNNNDMIVSRMLGDETQSGLVRNVDGTLDPEFKAWGDEYNNLRRDNDIAPAGLEELAIEFYTDNGVRALVEDVSSGRLFNQSRKTPLRRSIENSFTNLFASAPIVKNLHFKFGGATDAGGRMVMGTGLLADGMRELPEVKEMLRQAYKDTAGKPLKQVNNRVPDVKSTNPNHYEAKETINKTNKRIVDAGEKLPENVMIVDSSGNGRGQLSINHFKDLDERGVIDNGTFSMAAMLQEQINSKNKFAVNTVNKPIEQGRSVQIEGLAEGLVVPTGWVSRNGRLYLEAMDLKQLEKNVQRAVKNSIAKKLNLNRQQILDDIQESVAIQNKGQSTDAYYKSKDSKNWEKRKNFINSVLGLQTKKQLTINPLIGKVSPDLESGIFRTFAFDRLQSAIQTNSNVSIPFGANSYYAIRDNLLPQSPRFNRNGELVKNSPDTRYLPKKIYNENIKISDVPINEKFISLTKEGKKFLEEKTNKIIPGSILGTVRFMPENKRIMENFPVDNTVKTKMEGKVGFAFVSDWADSNRSYVTRNGRDIDVLTGGVGYTYHPDVIGKGGWAGSFSPLTNRVLKKINQTDGIGLVVAGGRESTASSRSFSLAFMEELRDDLTNKTISKSTLDNIIKNNAEQILGRKDIKSFSDYNKLLKIENNYGGLTFEQRADMIKKIGSDSNKKAFGILNWNDVLKKYEMQNGEFQSGQIMSVVQFKKDAPLARGSEIGVKEHKSYEAVIQGKPLGMLTEKVMIGDFFKDFFDVEGTQPASYTRKVQTKMPSFKYGKGSAVFSKSSVELISKVAKMKDPSLIKRAD